MSRREPIGHLLVYLAGRLIFALMALLPTRAARRVGAVLGRLFFHLSPRHRRIALGNLAAALGDRLSETERLDVAHASFAHLGAIVADATHFPRHVRRPTEELAVYDGVEHLQAAAALGRGVLVFSGHYGHWELVALLQHRLGLPMTMVVSPLENTRYDRFITRLRQISGNTILSKRRAARPILKALHEGRAIAILIDQNVRGEGGLFVDFFGRPASTTPALATLAFRSGAPIVPVFSWFLPDGRLQISYRPMIQAVRQGAIEDDIRVLTRSCTAILEEEIRRRPSFWMWMHNRWRTRPPEPVGAAAAGTGRRAEARG
ncbi:MAG TPA: lysophospholipid acyltransferase family protein [Patescibacteria group bacterium]|nr:lysophospholipid acyltransferase family protein [Patescibacteria group bacterium]